MKRLILDLYARGTILNLGHETKIMGIVNCTPDSFSGDGKLKAPRDKIKLSEVLRYSRKLIHEGADIIDVGGESTRPKARRVALDEEIRRVIPVIKILSRELKVPVSVDTSKMEVALRALDAGASIVNNVQGTQCSVRFLKMVRDYNASIVIMHMRGTPATMRSLAQYKNVTKEVIEELKISVEKCLEIGIKKDRIIIDPGVGFAKTFSHNLLLLNHLRQFRVLKFPLLLGTSRKSFIGEILNKEVGARLMGTAATVTVAIMQGAHIVRVHDVKAIKETIQITDAILNARI